MSKPTIAKPDRVVKPLVRVRIKFFGDKRAFRYPRGPCIMGRAEWLVKVEMVSGGCVLYRIIQRLVRLFQLTLNVVTGNNWPPLAGVFAVVEDRGMFLVVDRADGAGLGFPGGFLKLGETPEEGLVREIGEETGLVAEPLELLFAKKGPARFPIYTTEVWYAARVTGGELSSSWEGEALWAGERDLRARLAYDHEEILDRYTEWRDARRNQSE